MRIVSLTCSNTEIVCALGCSELLVGVDAHSDFPEDVVVRLPRVGPDLDIDVERVEKLAPDWVLASLTVPGHERIVERLERKKLSFIAPEPECLADVYADIRKIASLLEVSARGEALIQRMRAEIEQPVTRSELKILVEWWPKPIICPGKRSWVTELVAASGAENPLGERPVKSQPITDEDAASLCPDASVMAWCGVPVQKYRADVVLRRAAWRDLELVRKRRVFAISEAFLGRPGPRLVLGVRALRRVVRDLSGLSPLEASAASA